MTAMLERFCGDCKQTLGVVSKATKRCKSCKRKSQIDRDRASRMRLCVCGEMARASGCGKECCKIAASNRKLKICPECHVHFRDKVAREKDRKTCCSYPCAAKRRHRMQLAAGRLDNPVARGVLSTPQVYCYLCGKRGCICNIAASVSWCALCGKSTRAGLAVCSSKECQRTYSSHRYWIKTLSMNIRKAVTCSVCGDTFKTHRTNTFVCSRECKKAARRRDAIPKKVIGSVIERSKGKCHWCKCKLIINGGTAYHPRKLHIDHVIPVARGGGDEETNLVASCAECNGRKHSKIWGTQMQLIAT